MIIQFDIPNAKAAKIGDAMADLGFVFDPNAGTTENDQKVAFLKQATINYWRTLVKNYDDRIAKETAVAALPPFDLNDVVA